MIYYRSWSPKFFYYHFVVSGQRVHKHLMLKVACVKHVSVFFILNMWKFYKLPQQLSLNLPLKPTMQELHIITPVYQPTHVPAIYHSIEESAGEGLKITWWPIFDMVCASEGEIWRSRLKRNKSEDFFIHPLVSEMMDDAGGFQHKNYVLEMLEEHDSVESLNDHWIYLLNDNNVLHPALPGKLVTHQHEWQDVNGVLFYPRSSRDEIIQEEDICFRLRSLHGLRFTYHADPFSKFVRTWKEHNANNYVSEVKEPLGYSAFLG